MASRAPAQVGLFKELWHKFPEVIGAVTLGAFGMAACLSIIGYRSYNDTHDRYRMHKFWYTVKRPTDVKDPDSDIYN